MARKSLKTSIKKIFKLLILISAKEAYILVRNLIGLTYHPFTTLRTIKKERDYSQLILILSTISLPLLTASFLTFILVLTIKFLGLNFSYSFKSLVVFGDVFAFLIFGLMIIYLSFWSWKVVKRNSFSKI